MAAARRLTGFPVFAKLDVRRYFASIDHEVLSALHRRRNAGARTLALLDRIVASHESSRARPADRLALLAATGQVPGTYSRTYATTSGPEH